MRKSRHAFCWLFLTFKECLSYSKNSWYLSWYVLVGNSGICLKERHMSDTQMVANVNEHEILVSTYLLKRNKSHNWQKKWFVLRRNQLSYYKDSKEYKASKVIPIADILSFSQIPDNHSNHFIVVTNERIYHLRALDSKDFAKWTGSLEMILKMNEEEEEEFVGSNHLFRPRKISDNLVIKNSKDIDFMEELNHDTQQQLNFSGTDDNFTSGLSDGGSGSIPTNLNQSTSSFQNQFPTPIPEEKPAVFSSPPPPPTSNNDPNQEDPSVLVYNSLSSDSPEHIIDQGYLLRLKKVYNQWKRYYIILTNKFLYFYKNHKDFESHKVYKKINLDDLIDVVELDPLSKSKTYCMLLITPMKRIRFCAENEEELTRWLVLLKTIVKTRKKKESALPKSSSPQ